MCAVEVPLASRPTTGSIPVISLFCGCGGMDLGFSRAGFVTLLALDKNKVAIQSYNVNDARHAARECDLAKLTGRQLAQLLREASPAELPRGVIGGPPCQAFSNGNTNKKRHDPRARLGQAFGHLLDTLNREIGLDFFVFENVVGLTTRPHRHRFASIQRTLRLAGFNVFVEKLDAGDFGVPQRRHRLLIVGINSARFPWVQFKHPEPTAPAPTVREAIGGLPEPVLYRRGINRDNIPVHVNHWTMYPKSRKFLTGIQGTGRSFKRLAWGKPSYTVAYGNREIHIHPAGNRRLSVFEAMLLQGFPYSYELSGSLSDQITQVSDALPPPLAEAVAAAIRKSLYTPIESFQSSLLAWWEKNQRQFPWRKTADPYKILIAEKLLQQTAATDNVVRAYRQIVTKYPNWYALAKARVGELRGIVEPLGFKYRASELVSLARSLCKHHASELPRDLRQLLKLPGVGDYCARALMSFAFGQRFGVIDTNVARFLVRYFGLPLRISKNPARDRRLHAVADALMPAAKSKEINLAILDICSAHCKAREPQCSGCPMQGSCAFYRTATAGKAVPSEGSAA